MQDTYENFVGKIIENERMRRGLAANDVYSGICSTSVYVKLESGEYGNVTEDDRVLCNYAYEIAKLNKDKKRMEIYQRWLTRR